MALSLRESNAVSALAEHLYDYLPGSGDPKWKGHVSFKTVAEKVGVGQFWQHGSKRPMITELLSRTLDEKRGSFERLILEVVKAGITYRKKKGIALKPDDIVILNGLILDVGFKFPDLWDPEFRDSLQVDNVQRAKSAVEKAIDEEKARVSAQSVRSQQLRELRDEFFALSVQDNRQAAGFSLEKLLNRLFGLEGLSPRAPFKVVGEQIDGSFDLDHETYLLEAKWEKSALPEAPLLTFRGKVEGKSQYTRGVFIAINGVSDLAQDAIVRGKQPNFFVVDGHDLTMVLSEHIELKTFLRQRRRCLAEEGSVFLPYATLWGGKP